MKNIVFKCYSELDTPENMLIIGGNQIKNISSQIGKDGRSKLIINYYNDELCFTTFFICDKRKSVLKKSLRNLRRLGNSCPS
jgi:hypothetical protein